MKIKIKKDDTVKVIAGRDKGKTGRVLEVDRVKGKVLIEGVSMVKRHTRPNPQKPDQGRHRGARKLDRDFERDDADLGRRADAGRLSRSKARARRRGGCASRARAARFWIRSRT